MGLLSSFFVNQLIASLEQAFIDHKPEMQQALANEVKLLAEQFVEWAESKTNIDLNGDGKIVLNKDLLCH